MEELALVYHSRATLVDLIEHSFGRWVLVNVVRGRNALLVDGRDESVTSKSGGTSMSLGRHPPLCFPCAKGLNCGETSPATAVGPPTAPLINLQWSANEKHRQERTLSNRALYKIKEKQRKKMESGRTNEEVIFEEVIFDKSAS